MKPLFMWAGGKTKMLKHYIPLMKNINTMDSYSEPFFGGGAMYLHVMQNYAPRRVFINDKNEDIINIYNAIKNDVHAFVQKVNAYQSIYIPLSKTDRKTYFYDLRACHADEYHSYDLTSRAAVLYFLMRTAFNGIWQINKNTNGKFGTPAGLLNQTNCVYDSNNVLQWSRLLNSTHTICSSDDWSNVPISDFTFMDPPYRDSFVDYHQQFPDSQLKKLMNIVENNKGVWLCNRDCGDAFFDSMNATIHRWPITYTAGRRKRTSTGYTATKATELVAFN